MNQFLGEASSNPEENLVFLDQYQGDEQMNGLSQNGEPEESANPRDNILRDLIDPALTKLVEKTSDRFPKLTEDHVTFAGAALVTGSAALIVLAPKRRRLATGMIIAGSLLDLVDGKLARYRQRKYGYEPSLNGELKDTAADKVQATAVSFALSFDARRRGNNVAANNYAAAGMMTSVPALLRAKAEAKGLVVGENGLGSRAATATLAIGGMALGKYKAPANITSSFLIAGTAITSSGRADVVIKGKSSKHLAGTNNTESFKKNAEVREDMLEKLVQFGIYTGAAAFSYRPMQRTVRKYSKAV